MESKRIDILRDELGDDLIEVTDFRGDLTVRVANRAWKRAAGVLKRKCGMNMFVDLCAADYPAREDRFEVVLNLRSTDSDERIRLKARCDGKAPSIESLISVYRGANWFEREAYDLFGIEFAGHQNLKRILCHHEFQGHPLRKDYPKGRRGGIPRPQTLMDEMHLKGRQGQAEVEAERFCARPKP
jgi:NADH-quinone oxidoreductase subunit C